MRAFAVDTQDGKAAALMLKPADDYTSLPIALRYAQEQPQSKTTILATVSRSRDSGSIAHQAPSPAAAAPMDATMTERLVHHRTLSRKTIRD
jgi:hypothetical protein